MVNTKAWRVNETPNIFLDLKSSLMMIQVALTDFSQNKSKFPFFDSNLVILRMVFNSIALVNHNCSHYSHKFSIFTNFVKSTQKV
jgi:hypothetical protein